MGPPGQETIFHHFDLDKKNNLPRNEFPNSFQSKLLQTLWKQTWEFKPFQRVKGSSGSWGNISRSPVSRLWCGAGGVREVAAVEERIK